MMTWNRVLLLSLLAAGLATGCTSTNVPSSTDMASCPQGLVNCSGECVNLKVNVNHCGDCQTACPAGNVCSDGKCGLFCNAPQIVCNGLCTNVQTDNAHCGKCGSPCPAGQVCSGGACGLTCQEGLLRCTDKCVNPQSDNDNCGGCGNVCGPGTVCASGKCVVTCQQGRTNCSESCVDLQTDLKNCGACGNTCSAGLSCVSGACELVCSGGATKCGTKCVDLQTDAQNCGACSSACATGLSCVAGACALVCTGGATKCGNACVNLKTDGANCGSCGNACSTGFVCSSGACALNCPTGQTACGSSCANLKTDNANCGACGNACQTSTATCVNGACTAVCIGGTTSCNNKCVNLQSDAANCGSCGNACAGGTTCCGGKCVDVRTDGSNCGACGNVCGAGGGDPTCLLGVCGTLPVYQHKWQNTTAIPVGSGWVDLNGASFTINTRGGPLEIEMSIPLIGGSHTTCRPLVDNVWAGTAESLPQSYIWHEGLDYTGFNGGTNKRMWKRTRVYSNIAAGQHTISAQCRTDGGTATAGRAGATALIITREFLGTNKVSQRVTLNASTMGVSGGMVKVPGSDLNVNVSGGPVEITISLPIGNGGHAGCLEWMDDALIPTNPSYSNTYWYSGLEGTYRGWIMWHHTRTYTSIPAGNHTFSIRCYNDSGTLNLGGTDMGSVIIVKEINEAFFPSVQTVDSYANGWEVQVGAAYEWYPLGRFATTVNVKRGSLDVMLHTDYHNLPGGEWVTCRPLLDGKWMGQYAGQSFSPNEEEGSVHEVFESTGWHGMWHRRRVYTGLPLGNHLLTLQCLSSGPNFYIGYNAHGSLLVREADVAADK